MPAVGWLPGDTGVQEHFRCMTFKQYMNFCLYDNQHGYYRSGSVRVGKQGDFYTSSAVGSVLAHCLSNVLRSYANDVAQGSIRLMEWGAGTGRLSKQIQDSWKIHLNRSPGYKCLPVLVDDHPGHLEEAKRSFSADDPTCKPLFLASEEAMHKKELWQGTPTVVLANELLDAFPVHRVTVWTGRLVELGVAGNAEEGFYEVYMPISDERIPLSLQRDGITLVEGQRTEVNLEAEQWLGRLGEIMASGRVLIIDYGHEAKEYTAEHRMNGTLLCYSEHRASDTPYIRIGEQDITAHVPFTSLKHAAEVSGWRITYYDTQKQFLMDYGAFELLQNHGETDPFGEKARINRAVRQLLLSDGMSEAFKVLILDK
ncbi:SAM-dependent methyltransferase [Paenibacillus glycanilyticus]|uniref:SAM-dependent methyltransferase n=2 Tax=Paenibacillus glycanilyticus TaxID=126569 RepID=A0ABQ6GDR9_9BACL|nr:SAM-dependent methyltransferase [Paenibacillus glycanilyticus]